MSLNEKPGNSPDIQKGNLQQVIYQHLESLVQAGEIYIAGEIVNNAERGFFWKGNVIQDKHIIVAPAHPLYPTPETLNAFMDKLITVDMGSVHWNRARYGDYHLNKSDLLMPTAVFQEIIATVRERSIHNVELIEEYEPGVLKNAVWMPTSSEEVHDRNLTRFTTIHVYITPAIANLVKTMVEWGGRFGYPLLDSLGGYLKPSHLEALKDGKDGIEVLPEIVSARIPDDLLAVLSR